MSVVSGNPDVEVLVTGYGTFGNFDENPAYAIVKTLPNKIQFGQDRKIILRVYPNPVRVAYRHVLDLVPQLYEQYPDVEYFIHVGVHDESSSYLLEKRARKGPYTRKDVDGRSFEPGTGDEKKRWEKFPEELWTEVDVDGILEAMIAEREWDIESSTDAGLFLCEFIYFNSMVVARGLREDGRDLKGLFFHVPPEMSPKKIKTGQDTLVRVVKEMVGSAHPSKTQ
ncbi:MAG: hypothetical protein M1813_000710 [Trichoglossum hirsutum]|nr:MAG: hypothetical protein M1813_000710 [Trichoglossum hirsutum]